MRFSKLYLFVTEKTGVGNLRAQATAVLGMLDTGAVEASG